MTAFTSKTVQQIRRLIILEIENEKEIVDLFRSKDRVFCLVEFNDYEELISKYTDLSLTLITRRGVGNRDMLFLSNR